jgi:hypothetical protein
LARGCGDTLRSSYFVEKLRYDGRGFRWMQEIDKTMADLAADIMQIHVDQRGFIPAAAVSA